MGRLRLDERETVRTFWRGHFEVWRLSGLTQRDYCQQHGLSLKSFGNWRGQLKREDAVGGKSRWGRHPRLKPVVNPMANPMAENLAEGAAPMVGGTARRRQFSEEAKRRIVGEAGQPGGSMSGVARRYGIDLRLLFRWRRALGLEPPPAETAFLPVQVADGDSAVGDISEPADRPAQTTMPLIVERPAPGIEIELIGGRRVRFDRDTDPETMKRVVSVLEGSGP
ncbi:MAG: transposase [Alphaproteobacteria bacterium]|nr:transposase [Alphaproteobacteria bacterium]